MQDPSIESLFPMGLLMMTPGVQREVPQDEIHGALLRHAQGDWGDLCVEDQQANDRALVDDCRLMSVYYTNVKHTKFWVITEADRSVTTVLLPEEY